MIEKKAVFSALRTVVDEEQGADIVSLGMISSLRLSSRGDVQAVISVSPERGPSMEGVRQRAESALRALDGVGKVICVLTAEKVPGDVRDTAFSEDSVSGVPDQNPVDEKENGAFEGAKQEEVPASFEHVSSQSVSSRVSASAPMPRSAPQSGARRVVFPVAAKHIIFIASGKGGVGKSTLATNIAAYVANFGQSRDEHGGEAGRSYKVGLLDADIYGPSVPKMTGKESYKPELDPRRKMEPARVHGMKVMSIGFVMDNDQALIWRGPMVQKALFQLLRDVAWGDPTDNPRVEEPLDFLFIDMPPGTGDAHLTLAQRLNVSGAVVVSTPQDIALIDARKAVEMFRKTDVPVLGVVENMSSYVCPSCGHEAHIFGHGGAEEEAQALGVPFLGAVPLDADVRLKADDGTPVVLSQPDSVAARAFGQVAEAILAAYP
ncbi:MAG: Mrp/NBP35 family ATP-binding protein [Alphaproteobacteria bacterium]|nr:Mrp/NBP35 family ATP-binding protein [Alphaproteobacteria bacterium]